MTSETTTTSDTEKVLEKVRTQLFIEFGDVRRGYISPDEYIARVELVGRVLEYIFADSSMSVDRDRVQNYLLGIAAKVRDFSAEFDAARMQMSSKLTPSFFLTRS